MSPLAVLSQDKRADIITRLKSSILNQEALDAFHVLRPLSLLDTWTFIQIEYRHYDLGISSEAVFALWADAMQVYSSSMQRGKCTFDQARDIAVDFFTHRIDLMLGSYEDRLVAFHEHLQELEQRYQQLASPAADMGHAIHPKHEEGFRDERDRAGVKEHLQAARTVGPPLALFVAYPPQELLSQPVPVQHGSLQAQLCPDPSHHAKAE